MKTANVTLPPPLFNTIVSVIARTNGCRHSQTWPSIASARGLGRARDGGVSSARVHADGREPTKKLNASKAMATGALGAATAAPTAPRLTKVAPIRLSLL